MTNTYNIPAGWAGFYHAETKKFFGISYFKAGGKTTTQLTIITRPTKEEVVAALTAEGVTVPA
jgi:hypothetical protein